MERVRVPPKAVRDMATVPSRVYVVYWLYDETCSVPENDGYVGITFRLAGRVRGHIKSGRFKPGFLVDVLFTGTEQECVEKEIAYRPRPAMGWNLYSGGKVGRTPAQSSRDKASRKLKGQKRSPHTCALIAEYQRNKTVSDEVCDRISDTLIGRTASDETRLKQSIAGKKRHQENPFCKEIREEFSENALGNQYALGYRFSEEECKRRSERALGNQYGIGHKFGGGAQKGHVKSPEWRAALSEARKRFCAENPGRKDPDETKTKKSAARKRWWKNNKTFRHSDETRAQMRESANSRPPDSELTLMRKKASRNLYQLKQLLKQMKRAA